MILAPSGSNDEPNKEQKENIQENNFPLLMAAGFAWGIIQPAG
ncbi:hypothetical protein [Sphingomonas sp. MMS24-J13]